MVKKAIDIRSGAWKPIPSTSPNPRILLATDHAIYYRNFCNLQQVPNASTTLGREKTRDISSQNTKSPTAVEHIPTTAWYSRLNLAGHAESGRKLPQTTSNPWRRSHSTKLGPTDVLTYRLVFDMTVPTVFVVMTACIPWFRPKHKRPCAIKQLFIGAKAPRHSVATTE